MIEQNDQFTDQYLRELIALPRVWTTLHNGIEIKELKSDRINEVIQLIKDHYIVEEPLMAGSEMFTDNESVIQYLNLAKHWMKDTLSSIAVKRETGNVIGFLICRFKDIALKDDKFSCERIYEGKIWIQLQTFKYYLNKRSDVFKHYDVEKVLEIYSWFVLPSYRGKGIGTELLKNVILRQLPEYKWFKTYVITGIFTGKVSQHIAESLGLKTLFSFVYAGWKINDEETGEPVQFFKKTISDNYLAKVMSIKINGDLVSERSSVTTQNIEDFQS